VVQKYEADKLVYSVARFLAGLKPKRGKAYYFEKFKTKALHKVIELKTRTQGLRARSVEELLDAHHRLLRISSLFTTMKSSYTSVQSIL